MKKKVLIIAISLLFSLGLQAQVERYMDSLRVCKMKIDSLQKALDTQKANQSANGKYYKIFSPLTYYPDVAGRLMDGTYNGPTSDLDGTMDSVLLHTYMHHPEYVQTTVRRLHNSAQNSEAAPTAPVQRKLEVVKETAPEMEDVIPMDEPVQLKVFHPNFWKFSGDYSLQFMQSHFSDNWYKGGENNLAAVGNVALHLNYNNKQKFKFENTLEMKVGVQTSESDTLHKVKTTSDLLRYTGKLGLQATKKWYYSFQLIASTQFFRGYKSNDDFVYSDFMSPLEVNASIGMDYTVDTWHGKLTGSINLAPIANIYKHVDRLALSTNYGLPEGDRNMDDWGSQMTINLTWKPSDVFKWETRLYAYTTYKKTVMEWENTISFAFNKYISAQVFLYPRFDDGVDRVDGCSYWQFKEYLSLGFSYSM